MGSQFQKVSVEPIDHGSAIAYRRNPVFLRPLGSGPIIKIQVQRASTQVRSRQDRQVVRLSSSTLTGYNPSSCSPHACARDQRAYAMRGGASVWAVNNSGCHSARCTAVVALLVLRLDGVQRPDDTGSKARPHQSYGMVPTQ
jgi:hypothetical protein